MKRLLPLLLLAASCTDTHQPEVGQYVYVDCFNSIHLDRHCASTPADNPRSKEERMANMQGVTFVDTCKLTSYGDYKYKFCPHCITDEAYEHLRTIMERNESRP